MMDGIFAGGDYVPNCANVTLYAWSQTRMNWYYPSRKQYSLHKVRYKPATNIMKHTAPVILAFWSDGDD